MLRPSQTMMNHQTITRVGLCETQPAAAEGVRSLLAGAQDLECCWTAGGLAMAWALHRQQPVEVMLVDKSFTTPRGHDQNQLFESLRSAVSLIIWGQSMSEPEALRLLQAGARGILHKSADLALILRCLRSVAAGGTWLEECVFRDAHRMESASRTSLTSREREVLELVEQGLRNKEIAKELGIQPGTVKIHMKHIFEKTGVHGRYGLALNGLRQKGLLALTRTHENYGAAYRDSLEEAEVRRAS